MKENTNLALHTPIIGKATLLLAYVRDHKKELPKDMQREEWDQLHKACVILYLQAFREVRGKDYLKRATETLEEIQMLAYLIYGLKGWPNRVASRIDVLCDEIIEELIKARAIKNSANFAKSKDESNSA